MYFKHKPISHWQETFVIKSPFIHTEISAQKPREGKYLAPRLGYGNLAV